MNDKVVSSLLKFKSFLIKKRGQWAHGEVFILSNLIFYKNKCYLAKQIIMQNHMKMEKPHQIQRCIWGINILPKPKQKKKIGKNTIKVNLITTQIPNEKGG